MLRLPALIAIEYKRHQDSLQDKSSYRNPTMVWRAPSRQVNNNAEKPHGFNSYNRNHDGAAPQSGSATGSGGYPKQAWKPNRTEDAPASGTSGGYRTGAPAWNKPANDAHAPSTQEGGARGWARGQNLTAAQTAAAAAPAPAAAPAGGMSSATAALQAAVGLKTAAKPAVAPPIPAAPVNPWKKN